MKYGILYSIHVTKHCTNSPCFSTLNFASSFISLKFLYMSWSFSCMNSMCLANNLSCTYRGSWHGVSRGFLFKSCYNHTLHERALQATLPFLTCAILPHEAFTHCPRSPIVASRKSLSRVSILEFISFSFQLIRSVNVSSCLPHLPSLQLQGLSLTKVFFSCQYFLLFFFKNDHYRYEETLI